MTIPCSWDVVVPEDLCSDWSTHTQPVRDTALWLASTYLWAATGRQYGPCPVTVRPAQTRYHDPLYVEYPLPYGDGLAGGDGPYILDGVWRNAGCGPARCCADRGCSVVLRGPVYAVDEVLVDGEEIPSSAYRVDIVQGAYELVRLDGACWPTCQNFTAAEDAVGAFTITYRLGKEVPEALAIATALLACEYAGFLSGGTCRLPSKMTRMARQGVEIEVEPPAPADGLTGITQVDAIVAALNPSKRQAPPEILSPDLPENCDRFTVIGPGGS